MPSNITDVSTFTDPIQIPSDGESANSTSLALLVQGLANRTRKLKNRVDALAGSKTELIDPELMKAANGTTATLLNVSNAGYWSFSANSAVLRVPLAYKLRTGDVLTNVELCVEQGNAGASGQMNAKVYRQAVSASAAATALQLGSTLTFATGTGFKNSSIAIASNNTVDANLYTYNVLVTASALAGTNSDFLHWVKVTYTAYGSP